MIQRLSAGIKKKSEEIVLDFDEDDKDEDGELDLVQKLDNLDCIIYFIEINSTFSNATLLSLIVKTQSWSCTCTCLTLCRSQILTE